MNKTVKVKCPAKINLTLEVLDKRGDGFHNIKSIMQMINLYDYLTISVKESLIWAFMSCITGASSEPKTL